MSDRLAAEIFDRCGQLRVHNNHWCLNLLMSSYNRFELENFKTCFPNIGSKIYQRGHKYYYKAVNVGAEQILRAIYPYINKHVFKVEQALKLRSLFSRSNTKLTEFQKQEREQLKELINQ